MPSEKHVIVAIRLLMAFMIVPILLGMLVFGRVFGRLLRKVLALHDLDEVQRVLTWRGIKGLFQMSRTRPSR